MILTLFLVFMKIGALTFGGGYAMLPLIIEEVTSRLWLSLDRLLDMIAVSESTPGPVAVNLATFIGSKTAGVAGSAAATLGVVLPSFVIIYLIARFLSKFSENRFVRGVMSGLRPGAVGMIAAAVISVARALFMPDGAASFRAGGEFYVSAAVFLISLAVLMWKKIHPIFIICSAAAVGVACGYAFGL